MRSKIKSWILSRTIWYHLRELGFQVSVPNLFSKAGTSTEETLKTTEAPETGETTSRPGKFISFDLKFNLDIICVAFQSAKVRVAPTEESAESSNTTEAPETGETTSRPETCVSFDFNFGNMPAWYMDILFYNENYKPTKRRQIHVYMYLTKSSLFLLITCLHIIYVLNLSKRFGREDNCHRCHLLW